MTRTKKLRFIAWCMIPLMFSGCYEEKVQEAVSKLSIGMTKAQLDQAFQNVKFIKEQTVLMYPNSTEDEMRSSLIGNKNYRERYPENLIELLTFDGNIKVYSYLIRREKIYANPTILHRVAVFYDQQADKIIGWARMEQSGDVDTLRDKF